MNSLINRRRRSDPAPALEATGTAEAPSRATAGAAAPDAATEAQEARLAATQAREAAAQVAADAQAEARGLLAEAQVRVDELEADARTAEIDAARWQQAADRNAAIVATEAETATLEAARDRIAGEAAELGEHATRIEARLRELGAQHAEAVQRRTMAVRNDDEAALREALTSLTTAAELAQARTGDLAATRARLAEAHTEHEQTRAALGRAGLRLMALRREEAGLPPAEEAVSLAMTLLPVLVINMMNTEPDRLAAILMAAVPAEQRPAMEEAVRLAPANPQGMVSLASAAAGSVLGGQILTSLQQLALDDREQYEAVKRMAFAGAAPEPVHSAKDEAADMVRGALAAGGAR